LKQASRHGERQNSQNFIFAELKKCLFCLFAQFGQIADVQCRKTNKLRGQAWIIFADVASATNALQCMNAFPFFDKPIVCTLPLPRSARKHLKNASFYWCSV
jgi:RNA recognition motif-containing protein